MLPLTVKVNAGPPANALRGDSVPIEGTSLDLRTEKVAVSEVPPPGAAFNTATVAVPTDWMSAADICVVSWVALTKVVAWFAPFHLMTEPSTKFVPFTVRVKAGSPAIALAGDRVAILGTGLLILRSTTSEEPPPGAGLNTEMLAVSAF